MSADDRHKGDIPMKAPGCPWRFWSGVVGISSNLVVWEGSGSNGCPIGFAKDLKPRARVALANYMIGLWTRFRDEGHAA